MGWMWSDRLGRVARCSTATLVPVTLLTVMFSTFSITSLGLEAFCFRRPRTTFHSDATGELRHSGGQDRSELRTGLDRLCLPQTNNVEEQAVKCVVTPEDQHLVSSCYQDLS